MVGQLDDGDREAPVVQVLGELEPDEAPADDDRRLGPLRPSSRADDGVHVDEVAQGVGELDAGDGRPQRARAGGQHQGVVRLLA